MIPIVELARRTRLWPGWALAAAALVILPGLGSFGFWEPWEMQVAERARGRLERYSLPQIQGEAARHFKVPLPHLTAAAPPSAAAADARGIALYLARQHTRESNAGLRRAFQLAGDADVEAVVREARAQLAANSHRAAAAAAIEAALEETRLRQRSHRPGPPLSEAAAAWGMSRLAGSASEWASRLPLALLALVGVVATYALGVRLRDRRTGLLAAAILLSFPLFVFQSRQLTSDIGAVTGSTLLALGLAGWALPRPRAGRAGVAGRRALDAILIAVGALLAYYAAGAVLGLFAPLVAAALAALMARPSEPVASEPADRDAAGQRRWSLAAGGVAAVAAAASLAAALMATFDLARAADGGGIAGYRLVAAPGYVAALGGAWKGNPDPSSTFNSLFEHVAYGLYPWTVLVPLAAVHCALGRQGRRRAWADIFLLSWVLAAWFVATLLHRRVGPVSYPALAAVAIALALWLGDLFASRAHVERGANEGGEEAPEAPALAMPPRQPLAAFFIGAAALVLGADLARFTAKIVAVHIPGATAAYPKELGTIWVLLAAGGLFGLALAVDLAVWRPRRLHLPRWRAAACYPRRHALHIAVAIGLGCGLFYAHVWTPALSRTLSSRRLFSVYHQHRSAGDKLGIMGHHGQGPRYYAGDDFTVLRDQAELLAFLGRPERVFALVPAGELCTVNRHAGEQLDYYVLDDSHANFLLLSNRLNEGEADRNPLTEAIRRHPPPSVPRELRVNFDDRIELLGFDAPKEIKRGKSFTMTFYFRVLQPVTGTWKIFVHFDRGSMRFQGDHPPIAGRCSTALWRPGDYIVDRFVVQAGNRLSTPRGSYRIFAGFFVGSHGDWRNMTIVSGPKDQNDRADLGELVLK